MTQDTHTLNTEIRDTVRQRYAAAAIEADKDSTGATSCCGSSTSGSCGPEQTRQEIILKEPKEKARFGGGLYNHSDQEAAGSAIAASLGCGVPTAVADLHPGEVVLDLGSGAGSDVLIAARRVMPGGKVIGLDMTPEMIDLARRNAETAGLNNVEFVEGYIEDIPLPTGSVDVVISNCVINLAADKQSVLKEAARVLRHGGHFAISDVIADSDMDDETRADMTAWTGCIAGALTEAEYREALSNADLENIEIIETHRVHPHAWAAIVRAQKPTKKPYATTVEIFDPPMC